MQYFSTELANYKPRQNRNYPFTEFIQYKSKAAKNAA